MRHRFIIAGLATLALSGFAGSAEAAGWGIGGFGGVSIPIAQDDAANGVVFGGHLRLSLGGMLGIEPNFTYFKNGDWEHEDLPGQTFKGSKVTAVGINAILGGAGAPTGFRLFPFAGVKYYNLKSEEVADFSDGQIGWNGGLGFEIGSGPIGVDIRGSAEILPLDGGGSRKWVHVRGGLNYYFGAN